MKISHAWLQALCPHSLDAAALAERLTLAGLEVEELIPAAEALDGVVVARILSAEQHPNADRLRVCTVDAGADETLQIVCGAPNARAGLQTALATIGTKLPGDFKIKKGKIRGEVSMGMLCSGAELGLEETAGILELDLDAAPGTSLHSALGLDDSILDIALTPNRGDCLSALGIAREIEALGLGTLQMPSVEAVSPTQDAERPIQIADKADCSWYCGRVISGLDTSRETPLWMRERLRRGGLRSHGPLVDITNYILLELGQPLHAFDQDRLQGGITVRRAQPGESLRLLNEEELQLSAQDLLITDASGPVALAGAMGGDSTAVQDGTHSIFLESACFSPAAVAGLGRRHKLVSDALHRFERGTDPNLPQRALERATALLLEICGGQAGPICSAGGPQDAPAAISLDLQRCNAILGSQIEAAQAERIFHSLGCQCQTSTDAQLEVIPPSWRRDLAIAEDLMEELARVIGYDHLGGTPCTVRPQWAAPPPALHDRDRVRDLLRAQGWSEIVGYSFVSEDLATAIRGSEGTPTVRLANPISEQLREMRPSLWASLIPAYAHNLRQSNRDLRLFEMGRVFEHGPEGSRETEHVAGLCGGRRHPEAWNQTKAELDFFDAKGVVEDLLKLAGRSEARFVAAEHVALQPGQSARVELDGTAIGWVGRVHPRLWKAQGEGEKAPYAFTLEWPLALRPQSRQIQALPPFPGSRRDLSLLVPPGISAEDLISYIKDNSPLDLPSIVVFDRFEDDSLEDGFKSLAFGLIFQDFSRTLQDGVIDEAVATLVQGLSARFQVRLRD